MVVGRSRKGTISFTLLSRPRKTIYFSPTEESPSHRILLPLEIVLTEALLVFVRWPEPGRAKTRLVPRLGSAGAARFYRGMAERTVATARRCDGAGLDRVVWFTPRERAADIADWLGQGLRYEHQPGGDLGSRLEHAFRRAFAEGATRVVAVGTDCPSLDPEHVHQAFRGLEEADAVVGPAEDGGYYLLGLARPFPDIFRDIPWSTDRTFAETLARLRSGGRSIRLLPALRDVDRPEDLDDPALDLLSVVVPVLNEEREISGCLEAVFASGTGVEVVVVDGGSADGTPDIARAFPGVHLVRGPRGRGAQMNEGVRHARGDVLWFLHADCRPRAGSIEAIRQTLTLPGRIGGAFRFAVRSPHPAFRAIEMLVHLRNELLVEPYGDQGIFATRDAFHAVGGYAALPILEDLRFVRALRSRGGFRALPLGLPTSARRWERRGILATALRFQAIALLDRFGVRPERLAMLLRR